MTRAAPILALALLLALAPLAAAQVPLDPATSHVAQRLDDAQGDPKAATSPDALQGDLAWAAAYACDVGDALGQATGAIVPGQEERCDDLEAVAGIDDEPDAPEPDVGAAEPIEETDEVIGEAVVLADEAEDALGQAIDDPASAPEAILGFLASAAAAVDRLLDGLVDALASAVDALLNDLGLVPTHAAALPSEAAGVVALAFQTGIDATTDFAHAAVNAGTQTASAVASAATGAADAVADGIGDAGRSVTDAVTSTAAAVGDAATSLGEGVRGLLASLFGGHSSAPPPRAPVETGGLDGDAAARGLLDDVTSRVDAVAGAAR